MKFLVTWCGAVSEQLQCTGVTTLALALLTDPGQTPRHLYWLHLNEKESRMSTGTFEFLTSSSRGNYVWKCWNWQDDPSPSATWWYSCQRPITKHKSRFTNAAQPNIRRRSRVSACSMVKAPHGRTWIMTLCIFFSSSLNGRRRCDNLFTVDGSERLLVSKSFIPHLFLSHLFMVCQCFPIRK